MSFKALSMKRLRGNLEGNKRETCSFLAGNPPENQNATELTDDSNHLATQSVNLFDIVSEALAEVDRLGRPWPRNFFDRLTRADHDKEKDLVRRIDAAVLAGNQESLESLIAEWQDFLLDRRNQQMERV